MSDLSGISGINLLEKEISGKPYKKGAIKPITMNKPGMPQLNPNVKIPRNTSAPLNQFNHRHHDNSPSLINPITPLINLRNNENDLGAYGQNELSREKYKTLIRQLKEKLEKRKEFKVTYCNIFKQTECRCCLEGTKDSVIKFAMEYVEKASKVTNLIKLTRCVEMYHSLILKEEQAKVLVLPSLNISREVDEQRKTMGNQILNDVNEEVLKDLSNLNSFDKNSDELRMNIVKSVL